MYYRVFQLWIALFKVKGILVITSIKQHSRWPIRIGSKVYKDRLELLMDYVQQDKQTLPFNSFLPHQFYYVRAALEAKFGRHFSTTEVRKIINDKSWQTQGTPSQALNKQEGTVPFSNATTINNPLIAT